jgi:Fe-Mn family superoxide dismutase
MTPACTLALAAATALRLRAAGLKARYLRGGIEAWQAAGRQGG